MKFNSETRQIPAARFEFYVYKKMYHHLDRGRLFCNDSVSYCDLEMDLVSDELVDQVMGPTPKAGQKFHSKIIS